MNEWCSVGAGIETFYWSPSGGKEEYRTRSRTEDNQMLSVIGVGGLILIVAVTLIIKAYRIKQENKAKSS
ncbi:hypothetical protein ANCDUO_00686 [Ancylostoma duodenale]|uniref:Uncharacterized protein n=1 Tax=Ancylostoma duodenale TaxID=51022 RepID=A0A0C2HBF5_9BILA|nr:hypothetical protein ANCDUO_00686 [Ancylostoma duodenale]